MVYYFIYAKDFSMSTRNVEFYHKNGLKTLENFKNDVNKIQKEMKLDPAESRIVYLHWGNDCVEVDEEETVLCYQKRKGESCNTLPHTIIEWITSKIVEGDKIKLLYIITDGLIGSNCANRCFELNQNIHYEKVVFHGLHLNLDSIDLSVASSFLKGHCTIYRNNEILDDIDVSAEFDYDKITIDNFITEKENLKSYIKLKYINSTNSSSTALNEIDKLKKMRNRLLNNLKPENYRSLNTTDKNTFLIEFKNTSWYISLTNPTHDLKINIEKSVSTFINYIICEKKSYAFDALKFDTKFNNETPEEPIVDINFTPEQEIEFPDIILNDDKGIPVILCTELNLLNKIIFHGSDTSVSTASFSKFKSVMDCPLFLLKDPDLNNSVGYFYTLNVYKQLLQQPTKLEPRSRRPFHGGLVLTDTDEFDKYNDYILSATYFDFKKVKYNIGLFYFVLWKICEQKQWMDKNVVEQFKKYMQKRIRSTMCYIGLSSLPLEPHMITSLPTALWYCVEMSSYIFKNDPLHFTNERLRMYYGVVDSMIEILNYFQYKIDLDFINKRRELISNVMILKKIPKRRDQVFYLLEKAFKTVNNFIVCEITNPEEVKKLNYLKINHKEMLSDDIITDKVDLNDYVHCLHYADNSNVVICEKSFRPYFMIDQNKSYYTELYNIGTKIVIGEVDGNITVTYDVIDKLDFSKMLSLCNLFLNCVKDNNKYPSLKEYEEYILKKKKFKDELVTIFPVNILQFIENAYLSYEKVISGVSVSEFIRKTDSCVNRVERIKTEKVKTFENDSQIREFICKEEKKYNSNNV